MAYAVFPAKIALMSRFGPSVQVSINAQIGGREDRISDHLRPRIRVVCASPISEGDYLEVVDFFWAQEGPTYPFLMWDWSDYQGTAEPIGTGNGSTTAFQVIQRKTNAVRTLDRPITHIRAGTLAVRVNGVLQVVTTDYTVNLATGIITFTSPPGNGLAITADFEFDILVRFVNDWLPAEMNWRGAAAIPDIQMLEVIGE